MVYETIFDYATRTNTTGIAGVFSYVSATVPIFTPLLLLTFFLILTFGSYFSQIRLRGFGDFWASFTVGALVTTLISFVMYMIVPPVANIYEVGICFAITIVGVIVLFSSNER